MGIKRVSVSKSKRPGGKSAGEETLWLWLECEFKGIWRREFRFHPERRWRFDFAYPEKRLAVEVEGIVGPSGIGRHQTAGGYEADCEKYAEAMVYGWQVLRLTPRMVKNGKGFDYIEELTHTGKRGREAFAT